MRLASGVQMNDATVAYRINQSIPSAFTVWKDDNVAPTLYRAESNLEGVDDVCNTSFTTVMNTITAAGYAHIYVKTNGSTLTWTDAVSIPANMILEADRQDCFVIQVADPATDYFEVGAKSMLLNVSVYDKIGVEIGMGTNGPRAVRCYYNATNSAQHASSWEWQFAQIDSGAAGIDRPCIGINEYGIGDAIFLGVNNTAFGVNVFLYDTAKGMIVQYQTGASGNAIEVKNIAGNTVLTISLNSECPVVSLFDEDGNWRGQVGIQAGGTYDGTGFFANYDPTLTAMRYARIDNGAWVIDDGT